jgi:hypothetical protein
MGEWMYRSTFSLLGTNWWWVVGFMPQPLYPQGKSPWYPLDRRLGGPQSRSKRHGEVKTLAPTGTWTPTLGCPARGQSLYWLSYPGSQLHYGIYGKSNKHDIKSVNVCFHNTGQCWESHSCRGIQYCSTYSWQQRYLQQSLLSDDIML